MVKSVRIFIFVLSYFFISVAFAGNTQKPTSNRDTSKGGSGLNGVISQDVLNSACQESGQNCESSDAEKCAQQGGTWDAGALLCMPNNLTIPRGLSIYGQACQDATDKATADCNFEGNPDVQGVMGLAGQLKSAFDQMVSANPQLACSKLAQLSGAASAASGAFNTACSASYSKCQSACQSDLDSAKAAESSGFLPAGSDAVADIRKNIRRCQSVASSLSGAANNIAQFAQVNQAMSYCQSQTGDSWAEHCRTTPTDPYCATAKSSTDCTDPTTAATNRICICQRNPNDPKCGNANLNNMASKATDGTDGAAGKLDSFGGPSGDFASGINDSGTPNPVQPAGGSLSLGGSGGKGGGISGGGGNSGRGGAGGSAAGGTPGLNTKIVSGYGVGGRGGSGFSGAGGSAAGGTPGGGGGGYAMNAKPGVDLKQFLPGGQKDPARGLAGVSGPDGITGPNSNIWQKISARYFSVSPSLLP
jgi:hypothetical protein